MTLRTKDGGPRARADRAVGIVDLASVPDCAAHAGAARDELQQYIVAWARSIDIYAMILDGTSANEPPTPTATTAWATAQRMWLIDCFPKPMVAVLAGAVGPAAHALAAHATHRVGLASCRFAIAPDILAGQLPLAGVAHALARLPSSIGEYMALTGASIGAADALALGLLTHTVGDEALPRIIAGLADAMPVDPLLDDMQAAPGAGELSEHQPAIARCFSLASVPAIRAALERESNTGWATRLVEQIQQQPSPLQNLKLRLIQHARSHDLRQCLQLAHALANIDPADAASIEAAFSFPERQTFLLPERSELANGRF